MKKITVYCGSNQGDDPSYRQAALDLADALCNAKISLVYGGAKSGLMGILADRIIAQQGKAIGVITESLVEVEIAHDGLTDLHIVNSMHERKALMINHADAFIMLPGGLGSLDEFFEVLTWSQLGYHTKPCGILNINNYFDHLLHFLDHAHQQGFIKSDHRQMIKVNHSPATLIDKLSKYKAPQ